MTCEGCVHSMVKAKLIEFRYCTRYRQAKSDGCIDFRSSDASKR